MKMLVASLTAALLLSFTGCSSKDRLYPTSGTVTYHGLPAAGAVVSLVKRGGDSKGAPPLFGVVGKEGSFELMCGDRGRGAPAGEYVVLIQWTRVVGEGRRRPQTGPDLLQGRYADPTHPRLRATVKAENNRLPPFDLTD